MAKVEPVCPARPAEEYVTQPKLSIAERSQLWLARRDLKVQASIERKQQREVGECTFKPKTTVKRRPK